MTKREELQKQYAEYERKLDLVLKRDENDKYPFSFGPSKAKLVAENTEAIKQFIAEEEKAHG
jgi:hypothetical protein